MSDTTSMKALQLVAKQSLEFKSVPIPVPGKGQILVETIFAGICGSDVHAFNGLQPDLKYPRTMGHELVGKVIAINGTDVGLIGATVVVDPSFRCGACDNCLSGKENICSNLRVLGVHCDGGFAEYFVCDEKMAHRLPEGLSSRVAIFCEPLSIAVHAVRKIRASAYGSVLIIGSGPIGLALLLILKYEGICRTCTVIDMCANRLEAAKNLGADRVINAVDISDPATGSVMGDLSNRFDVIFDAVSNHASVEYDEQYIKSGGQVVIVGLANGQTAFRLLPTLKKELIITGTRMTTHEDFIQALNILSRVDPRQISHIVTHDYSFSQAEEALAFVEHEPNKGIKTILSFEREDE